MKLRPVDGLFLHQEAGTNLDFSSDAERVDALVADGLLRVGANDLPMIILGTVIHGLHRLAIGIETQQVKASVGAQVRDIRNCAGTGSVIEKSKFRFRVPE